MIGDAIRKLVDGASLSSDEMHSVFADVMDGRASDVQKAALIIALRMKGETIDEIVGAARAMRERVVPLEVDGDGLIDTCGTGGDGHSTFNVSTAAAIVAAAAGSRVAKHGNRAVSSACGSADVLAALGVTIDLDAKQMTAVLNETGIAFLFAPKLHPAMAAIAPVRRELGIRSIFNILGPLTNPAFARRQVLGVYAKHLVATVAGVLARLGADHAIVVHSEDGMDEISISAPTFFTEVREGRVESGTLSVEELGIERHPIESLRGGDAATNAGIIREVFAGRAGGPLEIVAANAGAALHVAGIASSIREGAALARQTIRRGDAARKLDQLIQATRAVSV
jgi:anthranilate phosphoribosyltransferase